MNCVVICCDTYRHDMLGHPVVRTPHLNRLAAEGIVFKNAFAGETLLPRRRLLGTKGAPRTRGADVRELFLHLCYDGVPHHVGVLEGNHAVGLRALARLTGTAWRGLGEGL